MTFLMILAYLLVVTSAALSWQVAKYKDGINGFTRTVQISENSDLKMVFQGTSLDEVLQGVMDISWYEFLFPDENVPDWLARRYIVEIRIKHD